MNKCVNLGQISKRAVTLVENIQILKTLYTKRPFLVYKFQEYFLNALYLSIKLYQKCLFISIFGRLRDINVSNIPSNCVYLEQAILPRLSKSDKN